MLPLLRDLDADGVVFDFWQVPYPRIVRAFLRMVREEMKEHGLDAMSIGVVVDEAWYPNTRVKDKCRGLRKLAAHADVLYLVRSTALPLIEDTEDLHLEMLSRLCLEDPTVANKCMLGLSAERIRSPRDLDRRERILAYCEKGGFAGIVVWDWRNHPHDGLLAEIRHRLGDTVDVRKNLWSLGYGANSRFYNVAAAHYSPAAIKKRAEDMSRRAAEAAEEQRAREAVAALVVDGFAEEAVGSGTGGWEVPTEHRPAAPPSSPRGPTREMVVAGL